MDNKNIALDKSMAFAIKTVKLYKYLKEKHKEYILSKQILRSGTSIGANLSEAQYGISKKDFTNKCHISLKEASETKFWLDLLYATNFLVRNNMNT